MKAMVGVLIDSDDMMCGLDCDWLDVFGAKPGSDEPQPRCSLCDRFLNESDGSIQRCSDCIEMENRMRKYAKRVALRDAVQNKEKGVKLLEATKYKIDITSFESVGELFRYITERAHIEIRFILDLTGLTRREFDDIVNGKEYPFLIRKVQETIGVPAPKHITSDEEMVMSSKLLHWSDK